MPRQTTARKKAVEGLRVIARGAGTMKEENFNAVIHERTRLGIVSTLAVNDTLTFTDLKRILDLTDGNLSIHAQKLEAAGYIECRKGFAGRVPRTEYKLTRKGRKALEGYLAHMEKLIHAVRDL